MASTNPLPESAKENRCPMCSHIHRTGELTCPNCGYSFNNLGRTRRVERPKDLGDGRSWTLSHEVGIHRSIVFEIEGASITLPLAPVIVVGRGDSDHPAAGVDLSPFGAESKGVSREHIRISREALIYVTDLG